MVLLHNIAPRLPSTAQWLGRISDTQNRQQTRTQRESKPKSHVQHRSWRAQQNHTSSPFESHSFHTAKRLRVPLLRSSVPRMGLDGREQNGDSQPCRAAGNRKELPVCCRQPLTAALTQADGTGGLQPHPLGHTFPVTLTEGRQHPALLGTRRCVSATGAGRWDPPKHAPRARGVPHHLGPAITARSGSSEPRASPRWVCINRRGRGVPVG